MGCVSFTQSKCSPEAKEGIAGYPPDVWSDPCLPLQVRWSVFRLLTTLTATKQWTLSWKMHACVWVCVYGREERERESKPFVFCQHVSDSKKGNEKGQGAYRAKRTLKGRGGNHLCIQNSLEEEGKKNPSITEEQKRHCTCFRVV